MKTQAGLWIDHKKAVVVTVTDKGEDTKQVTSGVETQLRRSSDSPLKGSFEAQQVPADDSRQNVLTGQLNGFYDEVIASVREVEAIFIFGPGEAKDELKKRLDKIKLGGRVVAVEAADKMSDRQVAAKVRERFPQ